MTFPDQEVSIISLDGVKELQFALAQADLEEEAIRRRPDRIKVLCLSLWYPLSMSRYFERAMKRNPWIDLRTTGVYTGSFIPWLGGMTLPEKYAKPPDIPLPFQPNVGRVNYEFVKAQLDGWTPDLVIAIDAGINWAYKPQDGYSVTIATDPHALDYSHQRTISDKFFNMQSCYSEPKDIYLPYAYDPTVHYYTDVRRYEDLANGYSVVFDNNVLDADAVLIGMPYQQRVEWVNELRKHGASVIFENAPVFDEYRELANRARIGLNWSSLNDLNARFFETPAFGLPMVANRVPDAHLFLTEDEDYLAFSTLGEAVEKVLYLKDNPEERERIAMNGYRKIHPHTYDARVQQILEECGL